MAINELFQNSVSVTNTEYFLAANSTTPSYQTTDGIVQCWLDLNNLVLGDEFRLSVYESISGGGTTRLVDEWTIAFSGSKLYVTPTLILLHGWDFSLTRLSASSRTISWSIRSVA